MKCTQCGKQWGDNAIPTICLTCLKGATVLDEEDHVMTHEQLELNIKSDGIATLTDEKKS